MGLSEEIRKFSNRTLGAPKTKVGSGNNRFHFLFSASSFMGSISFCGRNRHARLAQEWRFSLGRPLGSVVAFRTTLNPSVLLHKKYTLLQHVLGCHRNGRRQHLFVATEINDECVPNVVQAHTLPSKTTDAQTDTFLNTYFFKKRFHGPNPLKNRQ